MQKVLSADAAREHARYQNDLRYFCQRALRIKLKEGGDAPFVWNKAQRYLHKRVEDQLARTGMVRMFIIKGRQQGISTYIAARLYHKATRNEGRNVFILSHHTTTTETLFQIVDRYHNSCPSALTPKLLVSNNKRMKFNNKSQYTVGTAGSGSIGRGDTNQFFHGSEVAFYENIDDISTGVMQTVADIPGTEKFMESTANGVGNYFHRGCMDALNGLSEYELVFIPWYWQDEYRAPLKADFILTEEEQTLKKTYGPSGLVDDEQLQWRRNKIAELKAAGFGEQKFKQEYPFSVKEAFQASGSQLIDPDKVAAARKSLIVDKGAPLILGVDPGPINDRTAVAWRQGRHLIKVEAFAGLSAMQLVGKLARWIDRHDVAKVFIDVAEGRGVVDRLKELGYEHIVMGVSFAWKAVDEERYSNKRAEMAGEFKDWLEDDTGVRIPDDDEFEVEIGAIPAWKDSSNGRLILVPKDQIKKEYGRSPDLFDAAMLTFAQPVRSSYTQEKRMRKTFDSQRSELKSVNRRRGAGDRREDRDWFDDEGGIRRVNNRFRRR